MLVELGRVIKMVERVTNSPLLLPQENFSEIRFSGLSVGPSPCHFSIRGLFCRIKDALREICERFRAANLLSEEDGVKFFLEKFTQEQDLEQFQEQDLEQFKELLQGKVNEYTPDLLVKAAGYVSTSVASKKASIIAKVFGKICGIYYHSNPRECLPFQDFVNKYVLEKLKSEKERRNVHYLLETYAPVLMRDSKDTILREFCEIANLIRESPRLDVSNRRLKRLKKLIQGKTNNNVNRTGYLLKEISNLIKDEKEIIKAQKETIEAKKIDEAERIIKAEDKLLEKLYDMF